MFFLSLLLLRFLLVLPLHLHFLLPLLLLLLLRDPVLFGQPRVSAGSWAGAELHPPQPAQVSSAAAPASAPVSHSTLPSCCERVSGR